MASDQNVAEEPAVSVTSPVAVDRCVVDVCLDALSRFGPDLVVRLRGGQRHRALAATSGADREHETA